MSIENGHWYTSAGEPMHWIPKADGSGNRATTLRDAKKLGLLPSVTTILKVLNKPALTDWIVRQSVMAVCTAPDVPGEGLDAKVTRILDTERQQDQEAKQAADRGMLIHQAMEDLFLGKSIDPVIAPWVMPAYEEIAKRGKARSVECVVVGDGYAGRVDLITEGDTLSLWDWKTTKRLPERGAWPEHRLQQSAYAYAAAVHAVGTAFPSTGNVYISTVERGAFCVCEHEDPWDTYAHGFLPLLQYWQWVNDYCPQQQGTP